MKKLLVILIVIFMISTFIFGACAKPAPSPAPAPSPTPTPSPAPTPQVYEWKLAAFATTGMDLFKNDLPQFVKIVDERTNGQIKIELFPSGAIVPTPELLSSTAAGMIEMCFTAGAHHVGTIPVSAVEFSLPMSYQDYNDTLTLMWHRGLQDVIQEAYGEHGVYYLGFLPAMGNQTISTKPLRTAADFDGLKIRAIGTFANWLAKLGASPVNIPIPELYTSLKLGTVDAVTTGLGVILGQKLYEVCPYLTQPQPSRGEPLNILMNQDTWNTLSDELKCALTLSVRDWAYWVGFESNPRIFSNQMGILRDNGVEFIQLSPADAAKLQTAAIEVWDEQAKVDNYCAEGVAIIKEYLAEKEGLTK